MWEKNPGISLTPHTKKSKVVLDLNVTAKTVKSLEENMGNTFTTPRKQHFLEERQKGKKIHKLDSIKIKTSAHQKTPKWKDKPKKIFISHISDQELVSRKHKELPQINSKKTNSINKRTSWFSEHVWLASEHISRGSASPVIRKNKLRPQWKDTATHKSVYNLKDWQDQMLVRVWGSQDFPPWPVRNEVVQHFGKHLAVSFKVTYTNDPAILFLDNYT